MSSDDIPKGTLDVHGRVAMRRLSREEKELCYAFMRKVYEHTGKTVRSLTYTRPLSQELNLNHALIEVLAAQLAERGLIDIKGAGGGLRITAVGTAELQLAETVGASEHLSRPLDETSAVD